MEDSIIITHQVTLSFSRGWSFGLWLCLMATELLEKFVHIDISFSDSNTCFYHNFSTVYKVLFFNIFVEIHAIFNNQWKLCASENDLWAILFLSKFFEKTCEVRDYQWTFVSRLYTVNDTLEKILRWRTGNYGFNIESQKTILKQIGSDASNSSEDTTFTGTF